ILRGYDQKRRPVRVWARDRLGDAVTLRERVVFGEGLPDAMTNNLVGRIHQVFDESGVVTSKAYDLKGNVLAKVRQVIEDSQIPRAGVGFHVDWANSPPALDAALYATDYTYDALERVRTVDFPRGVDGVRAHLVANYDRAGHVDAITVNGVTILEHAA